jgi:putative NADH-flavin reductase
LGFVAQLFLRNESKEKAKMNIAVFGANGAIGKLFTKIALEKGDNVIAYVRRPESMDIKHANLRVIVGDLSNTFLIEQVISNADIVVSTLRPSLNAPRKSTESPIADGHRNIINVMQKMKKKRFLTLGTPSTHSDDDKKQLWTVLPALLPKVFSPSAYQEMVKIGQLVRSSLDWTVIRIINPNAKHNDNGYSYSLGNTPVKAAISRENVAAFFYEVASRNLCVHQMPIVFNK